MSLPDDLPLSEATFVAIDLETAGLSPIYDSILEVAAVRFRSDGTILNQFESLIRPGSPIPSRVTALTGIDASMVHDAPGAENTLKSFLEFLGDEVEILVAHSITTDLEFLSVHLGKLGKMLPHKFALDTLPVARKLIPGAEDYRLETLARMLEPDEPDIVAHRAMADAMHTRTLLLACLAANKEIKTLKKLAAMKALRDCPPPTFSPLPLPQKFEALLGHIKEEQTLEIMYRGGTRKNRFRSILPLSLYQRFGNLYLRAYCEEDHINKDYRLDRITKFRLLEKNEQMPPEA
jgi:DNA polymerase III epsilon subunit family exonuclease